MNRSSRWMLGTAAGVWQAWWNRVSHLRVRWKLSFNVMLPTTLLLLHLLTWRNPDIKASFSHDRISRRFYEGNVLMTAGCLPPPNKPTSKQTCEHLEWDKRLIWELLGDRTRRNGPEESPHSGSNRCYPSSFNWRLKWTQHLLLDFFNPFCWSDHKTA